MWQIYFFLLGFCSIIHGASVHSSRTLVLYDERITDLTQYSKYFNSLKSRSYDIEYLKIDNDTTIELFDNEQRVYDNMLIFPIKGKHLNKLVPAKTLLSFYEKGGDVLAITSPNAVVDSVRLFLNELGIFPSPKDYHLIDYMSKSTSDDITVSTNNLLSKFVFVSEKEKQLKLGKTSSSLLDNREQIVPILKATRGSVTVLDSDKNKNNEPWTVGSQGYLAAGFQNLANARVTWVGSDDLFSNKYYGSNEEFVQELAKWNFREKAVIKSTGFMHKHADGTSYEQVPYKVGDEIIYEIGITEWTGEKWEPFIAKDVQFELRLVDPYYRLTMTPDYIKNDVQYFTTRKFKLPDHHGVYTFLTEYRRSGLSFISERDVNAIRHLANDEYPRSFEISNAWVYITSIHGVILAWILFVVLFVIISSQKGVTNEKKTN